MPPANSPSNNPRDPATPPPPPQQQHHRPVTPPSLAYLSSPAPDLASTLYTQAAENADEANVSFLRNSLDTAGQEWQESNMSRSQSHHDPPRDPHRATTRVRVAEAAEHQRAQAEGLQAQVAERRRAQAVESMDDLSRRERLQRVLVRLNRIHDPAGSSVAAYSNRTPSPNRQRLYDWAPSHDEATQHEDGELEQIQAGQRQRQPDTQPDDLPDLTQSQLDSAGWESLQQVGEESWRLLGRDPATVPIYEPIFATGRRAVVREVSRRENEWASLRSRAVLQRARQENSPSTTDRMLRNVIDRERSGLSEEEERARGTSRFNIGTNANRTGSEQPHRTSGSNREPWPVPLTAEEIRVTATQERTDAIRRRYLLESVAPRPPRISTPPVPASSTPPTSSTSQLLGNALKYLNQLRACGQYEEALSAAIDHGLATKEFFADKHDDFAMDLEELEPLAASSWLQPGTVFTGYQHATAASAGLLRARPPNSSPHSMEQINPNHRPQGALTGGFDHPPGSTRIQAYDPSRPWLAPHDEPPASSAINDSMLSSSFASTKPAEASHDTWPVRVTIHSVDPELMTLQGTMEAYDVPQHPASISILNSADRPKAGKKHAPITTYLEGHIIDLATHSFLTPSAAPDPKTRSGSHSTPASDPISFPSATAHTDASNWRKLPPFNALPSDEELARCLLSKARVNELLQQFIFMRWKERCFVHSRDDRCDAAVRGGDQDRGHGLTIGGFYYLSLRRCDGRVRGLYFDPLSTPHQYLRLKGLATGWPAVEFR